ncbi:Sugar kinase of the NBD/HSP70 family, may contain an N-terminal HTH domain [Geodermatophilus telluris]|uniref:Sugar kinase of the NBD/HSP70 family, may contain an N-terminal HTH domain n=1 Tax=Geodermatophilus telluris TaxID=1190417 RepID=A0A1G6SVR5_9ACTN|nr:ROK family protein [Geodermatophilus telluris]SDD21040.1 Sugar kinase of the NBD/HSP70 family, may contain an N-terminal HTH domain [Geodermatophilus telluris]
MTTIRPGASVARQASLRSGNLALVLRTVCAAGEPPSRADVAAATGTTRATAARLVDDLVAGGLLDEVEQAPSGRRGRPATPLAPGARVVALGLQADAGLLAARVLDLRGRVVAERVEPGDLRASDPGPTLARLGDLAAALLGELPGGARLAGAGLALPGIVDVEGGLLLRAPNLGWSDVRPAALLTPPLPVELVLGNEADLAARTVAETAPARPGPHRDFVYLSGQIGVGGATVMGGRVVSGSSGWAGEVGHVCVDPDGPACRCGSTGCLEQYAGRDALLAAAGLPRDAGPRELARRVADGDRAARAAVERAAWALGVALAGVLNVLDVPTVVLGGSLGELADLVRPRLEEDLARRVLSARWRRPRVVAAAGAPAAGATGAALRALDAVVAEPARWLAAAESPPP